VALDEFAAHPLLGIGADNFQQQYLAHGRSDETPHYPHSVELRTLAQTGLIGALLALVGLGGARWWRPRAACAAPIRSGASWSAAALAGFAYWVGAWLVRLVLGVRRAGGAGVRAARPRLRACPRRAARPLLARCTGARMSSGAEHSGQRLLLSDAAAGTIGRGRRPVRLGAVEHWRGAGRRHLAHRTVAEPAGGAERGARLDERAADRVRPSERRGALNPLSDEPYLVAGSIALRFGDLTQRADHEFALALERTPGDAYATLERGAIASSRRRTAAGARSCSSGPPG
jgi:hypothetical protein